jgi:hypothetical protein
LTVRDVVEYVGPLVGEEIEMVGRVVSAGPVARVTVRDTAFSWPAASSALTWMTFVPVNSGIPLTLQFVVPVATPPPPRLFTHLTCQTATLSAAAPPIDIVEDVVEYVVPVVGAEIAMVGQTLSGVLGALGALGVLAELVTVRDTVL